jgi:oligopeptide transport system substrate-binding protein
MTRRCSLTIRWFAALAVLGFGLTSALTATGQDTRQGKDKDQEKGPFVVTEAVMSFPWTLDPHAVLGTDFHRFWQPVYETPLRCDPSSPDLNLLPHLLEAMPVLEDGGCKLTMRFKKGIRYADHECFDGGYGREVTGKDFVRVIKRHIDPLTKSPFYDAYLAGRIVGIDFVRQDALESGRLDALLSIDGIQVSDTYTVTIRFTSPYAVFIPLLAMPWMSMMPEEAMQRYGSSMSEIMVGTGPYVHDREASTPTAMVYKPNAKYWAPPPAGEKALPWNDGLRFELVKDLDHHERRFEAGDLTMLDIFWKNGEKYLTEKGRLRGNVKPPRSTLVKSDLTRLHHLAFNVNNAFLKKKEVRQALCLAVNRQWYMDTFYRGMATLADHIVPPSLPMATPKKTYPWAYGQRDQKRAAELLARAGHPYGKGLPEFILESSDDKSARDRQELEMLKEAWAKIGVKVQIRLQSFAESVPRVRNGLNEISVHYWFADYPDPDNFFLMLESTRAPKPDSKTDAPNYGRWVNAEYDELYRRASFLAPGDERGKLYGRMIEIVQEECPWLFIAHPATMTLVAPDVQGIVSRSVYTSSYATIRKP